LGVLATTYEFFDVWDIFGVKYIMKFWVSEGPKVTSRWVEVGQNWVWHITENE